VNDLAAFGTGYSAKIRRSKLSISESSLLMFSAVHLTSPKAEHQGFTLSSRHWFSFLPDSAATHCLHPLPLRFEAQIPPDGPPPCRL